MSARDWVEKDFYRELGVEKDASADDIKRAYRKIARENHPDTKPGDTAAETRFKAAGEAYGVLSDPEKRKEYDELRAMGAAGGFRFPGGGGAGAGGGFSTSDLGDLFGRAGQAAGGFGDVFSGLFNRGGGGGGIGRPPRLRRARLRADACAGVNGEPCAGEFGNELVGICNGGPGVDDTRWRSET